MVYEKWYQKICDWTDVHAEEMAADLQRIARVKSVSRADLAEDGAPFGPDCRKMLDVMLERVREFGFETDDNGGWYGDAWIGDRKTAVGIIGHLDVVPEGSDWKYPPYAATRVGDFLIGRGVSDNKSACVAGLYLMRMMRELGVPMKTGVRAVFGVSEETGMADLKHMVDEGKQPPVSLVLDGMFPVNYAQKSHMTGWSSIELGEKLKAFSGGDVPNSVPAYAEALLAVSAQQARAALGGEIEVREAEGGCIAAARGVAAHVAKPETGRSATLLLARALENSGLLDETSRRAMHAVAVMCSDTTGAHAGIAYRDEASGETTMVCGAAYTADGRVWLSLDCRLAVTADREANAESYRALAGELGMKVEKLNVGKPFYMPVDDARVRALCEIYYRLTGDETKPYAMGGGTYSGVVPNGITFGMGFPGRNARPDIPEGHGTAHKADEFIYLPNLVEAFKIVACAVLELDAMHDA